MSISPVTRARAVRLPVQPQPPSSLTQKDIPMTASPDLATTRLASPELLRSVFRQHAAGVAVITAQGARPVGFTATSLTSVAAEPPLISFGVGTGSSSWPVVAEAEHVGVHILGEHQQELAATFARSGADRFAAPTSWRPGPEGIPVLDGVVAWMVCRVVARVPAGDHRLVIAEAVAGDPEGGGRPLVYHQGRFTALRD
jgi:flavin reductase (DIM6/NTAB) family NADH-FMN oxidoreductase RutF